MSKNLLTNAGYIIQKNTLTKEQLDKLKSELVVTPNVCKDYGDAPESFPVYSETQDSIIIPRYYGEKYYGKPLMQFINRESAVDFEFTGKLRGTQTEVAEYVLNALKNNNGGLLQLHTGYGKTTMALYLASILKLKTLVIVHKSFLQDQWYDRIKQFTTASIGMIRQKKTDIVGKDIVIGMLQSISMIDYDAKIFEDFDFVIADECLISTTCIMTNKGNMSIGELYELWMDGSELPLIQSFNEITKCFEFNKMTYAWKKETDSLVRVYMDDKHVDCTPNHKFLTTIGYVEAQYLTTEHILLKYHNDNVNMICRITSVISININESNKFVYDIEVENNHNFIVSGKDTYAQVIVHNCHHLGSRVFSKALSKITPKYTLGLSATPNRLDGLTKVIKWYLGDTIVKAERKGDNAVYVKSFNYNSSDILFTEKKKWIKGNNKAKPDTVKMITNMHKINSRNEFITNILNGLRVQDERKTLVLSGRIDHLKILKQLTDSAIKQDVIDGKCSPDEFKTSFYIGKMKDYELKDSAESDIIFATYSMAEEGLDIDGLNTLVLATPKKNIIQSIGRIMRKPIEEGDVNPLIIDIIDDLSCFKTWGDIRIAYYNSTKYTVHNYKAFNNNLITFKEFMIRENMITRLQSITNNFDIRKEYIIKKYGKDTYDFEVELNFDHFPQEIFEYICDYKKILEINHDYSKKTEEHASVITYYK